MSGYDLCQLEDPLIPEEALLPSDHSVLTGVGGAAVVIGALALQLLLPGSPGWMLRSADHSEQTEGVQNVEMRTGIPGPTQMTGCPAPAKVPGRAV
jgi:hypothetical protein